MSAVILTREGPLTDPYRRLEADEASPVDPQLAILVALDRWQAERGTLTRRLGPIGLSVANTLDPALLLPDLARLTMIELEFPGFADGRAYSQARQLRGAMGYSGILRARGAAVVQDQLAMLQRCGFDQFALREDQDPEVCLRTLNLPVLPYQPAADSARTVRQHRLTQTAHS